MSGLQAANRATTVFISVVCAVYALTWGASRSDLVAHAHAAEAAPVPFVGCKSDGQVGPLDAPRNSPTDLQLDPKLVARLTLYQAEHGPAVLGPRGWFCFGSYGSSGASVIVLPTRSDLLAAVRDVKASISGFGIQASAVSGETSGRFTVADVIARVFPAYRSFVDAVQAEDSSTRMAFTFGPFPADRLIYRSDRIVEYETPAARTGLGSYFGLRPNGQAIRGVAILTTDSDLLHVAVRLPKEMNDLAGESIRQFQILH
jgi:hypothetical protein